MPKFLTVLLPSIYSMIFIATAGYITFDHKARFWLELDLAPFMPWVTNHPLAGLVFILLLMGGGSFVDKQLQTNGMYRHPLLGGLAALFLLGLLSVLYAFYITTTHYTYAHDRFYIAVIVILIGAVALNRWLKSRLF